MSEEEKIPQPEKTGLDEKRKTALLRYIAILFAVAFVLVLLSLFGQMRNSKTAISELSQSSTSALQKAEHLTAGQCPAGQSWGYVLSAAGSAVPAGSWYHTLIKV